MESCLVWKKDGLEKDGMVGRPRWKLEEVGAVGRRKQTSKRTGGDKGGGFVTRSRMSESGRKGAQESSEGQCGR